MLADGRGMPVLFDAVALAPCAPVSGAHELRLSNARVSKVNYWAFGKWGEGKARLHIRYQRGWRVLIWTGEQVFTAKQISVDIGAGELIRLLMVATWGVVKQGAKTWAGKLFLLR